MVAVSCNGYAVKLKFCIQIITWQLQPVSMISPTFSCRRDPQEGNILSRRWFEMGTQTINICLLREHVKWTIGTLPIRIMSCSQVRKPGQNQSNTMAVAAGSTGEFHVNIIPFFDENTSTLTLLWAAPLLMCSTRPCERVSNGRSSCRVEGEGGSLSRIGGPYFLVGGFWPPLWKIWVRQLRDD